MEVLGTGKQNTAWATGLLANAVEALRNAGASPARIQEIHPEAPRNAVGHDAGDDPSRHNRVRHF